LPIRATLKKNFYKDSVALMRISQQVLADDALARASLVMGTPANKDILAQAGLLADVLVAAQPADLMIALEGSDDAALDAAMAQIERLLAGERPAGAASGVADLAPRSLAMGLERQAEANLAQISVPGPYAGAEALKALRRGLHVFLFSDNVPLAEERAVKALAARKGLLVMGPDCGTAILGGVPLGFANAVRRGPIGLVGASGTGLQQVTTRIHALGGGVSHAIGTGSRDVYDEVGGVTLLAGLDLLARDAGTKVIVIVSKPPQPRVLEAALARARAAGKPVVVLFLGAPVHSAGNLHGAATLDEAAAAAVALAAGRAPPRAEAEPVPGLDAAMAKLAPGQRLVRGLFSGGTYCTEAQLIWRDAGLSAWSNAPLDDKLALAPGVRAAGHSAIDLGADEFTVGRPHPMIDPAMRIERILADARDPEVAAILLDVVLGYGAHADPAGALEPAIREARAVARQGGRELVVIAFACGTEDDPQPLSRQRAKLAEAGALLAPGSAAAALAAARIAKR
jgi:succinyl-CoA synthetase alpha subunit